MKSVLTIATLCILLGQGQAWLIYGASCECVAVVSLVGEELNASKMFRDVFNKVPRPESCDQDGFDDCQRWCSFKFGHVTNGYTLSQPLKAARGMGIAFGQLLCNLVGRDVQDEVVSLRADFKCTELKGFFKRNQLSQKGNSGQRTEENLYCHGGKFELVKEGEKSKFPNPKLTEQIIDDFFDLAGGRPANLTNENITN
ncbi:hypothetical protein HDE_09821 [Halotydeus destructor]|nr:hypothetical protein HDE_09821 [Halotydeus destructor]